MTTILLNFYLIMKRVKLYIIIPVITTSNRTQFSSGHITKFAEGGYVTLIIAVVLISIMTIWYLAKQINKSYTKL
jgi:KUP system potassium uptake protein